MTFQVIANLYFSSQEDAESFVAEIKVRMEKAQSINEDSEDPFYGEELSSVSLIENHHDETPITSCLLLEKFELKEDKLVNFVIDK